MKLPSIFAALLLAATATTLVAEKEGDDALQRRKARVGEAKQMFQCIVVSTSSHAHTSIFSSYRSSSNIIRTMRQCIVESWRS